MSTAAIVIDNFLSTDKWNTIQSGITSYVNSAVYMEERNSLHTQINGWIEDKLKELLDNKSKSMLYPLDCFDSLSYEGWLEYKKEAEAEDKYREEQRQKQMQK